MSRELSDIYAALQDGLGAVNALETWVHGHDALDRVRARRNALNRGMEAYERLSRNLREGRQHIADEPESTERRPRAANLAQADEGHVLCSTCEGVGTTMIAKMYPTGHTEEQEECPDCGGEGQVECSSAAPSLQQPKEGAAGLSVMDGEGK